MHRLLSDLPRRGANFHDRVQMVTLVSSTVPQSVPVSRNSLPFKGIYQKVSFRSRNMAICQRSGNGYKSLGDLNQSRETMPLPNGLLNGLPGAGVISGDRRRTSTLHSTDQRRHGEGT